MGFSGNTSLSTRSDHLLHRLRDAIVEGQIPAGSKISEPDLARRYDVSRSAVREAIGRLEACGLLTRQANIGARVISLDSAQLLEIYQVREALEGMAARLAATRMAPAEVAELQTLMARHRHEVNQAEGAVYFQKDGDLDFHYRIVQGSHNHHLIDLLCNDLYYLMRMYRYQFGMASRRARPALTEHEHILGAIAAGDGEIAELLMRHHIRASRRNIEQRLKEMPA
jgi:DNA-binding GntR family transcriptional regulator